MEFVILFACIYATTGFMNLSLFGSKLLFALVLWLVWMIGTFAASTYSYYKGMHLCAQYRNTCLSDINVSLYNIVKGKLNNADKR